MDSQPPKENAHLMSDSPPATMQKQPLIKDDLGVDEPQNWPLAKKVAASLAASGYTFALLYGATCYTTGLQGVMQEFNVSMTRAIVPYSLYIWGILFAPLYSPHVSERIGRNRFYLAATLGLGVFTLGAAYSRTYAQLAVCRFFAGLLGGSSAVQIEGTFADLWPALYTSSYYVFIASAQYFGAACGAVIGWHVTPSTNWRWTQYTTLMFVLAAILLGVGVPETYRRELVRRRAKELKQASPLEPALSGSTVGEMVRYTLIDPVVVLVTQPLVTMIALYMALNFGVLFSWFILVPVVLQGVAGFTPQQVGSAFATAIGGMGAAAILTVIIDQLNARFYRSRMTKAHGVDIEFRMFPAMFGAILLTTSLFWIGWTANANFKPVIPVVGNGIYVMGSAMTLIGFIPYLFDAYGPQGTLSSLTVVAVGRLALAGTIPLVILPGVMNIGGAWMLSIFGFISVAFLPFPFLIFFFGKGMRMKSRFYSPMSPMNNEMDHMMDYNDSEGQMDTMAMQTNGNHLSAN